MVGDAELTLREAAQRLGVHYMTVYRYVRTGQLPARRAGAKWSVDARDLAALTSGSNRAPGPRSARVDRSSRLLDCLTRGDEAGAWTVVQGAMASGLEARQVYADLLVPALVAVGTGWATGAIPVAEEHRASVVATRLVGRLGPRFARRGRSRGSLVVGAPSPGSSTRSRRQSFRTSYAPRASRWRTSGPNMPRRRSSRWREGPTAWSRCCRCDQSRRPRAPA